MKNLKEHILTVLYVNNEHALCQYQDDIYLRVVPIPLESIENLNEKTLLGSELKLIQTDSTEKNRIITRRRKQLNKEPEDAEKFWYFMLRDLGMVENIVEYTALHNQFIRNREYLKYTSSIKLPVFDMWYYPVNAINNRFSFLPEILINVLDVTDFTDEKTLYLQDISSDGKLNLMIYFYKEDTDPSLRYEELTVENNNLQFPEKIYKTMNENCAVRAEKKGLRIRDLSVWDSEYESRTKAKCP